MGPPIMATVRTFSWLLVVLTFVSTTLTGYTVHADTEKKTYIVYLGGMPANEFSVKNLHLGLLEQGLQGSSNTARESLVYSYRRSFNGFAAMLTEEEQHKLSGMEGVLSVFPSRVLKPHTTRSWDFMGFSESVKRYPEIESDIIVGMIDTGIWPESESFNDEGLGPIPSKWKGICQNFTCNKKVIGARYYNEKNSYSSKEERSPKDTRGHGSHTASTVAGQVVTNTSLYGIAKGTVRGAVPSARIAVYKVCWESGCWDHDILAAFDDAINDGVDILSVSLGGSLARDYFSDSIAIGSFHAMEAGILTSTSAGNSGPSTYTVTNVAPWLLSVAASSTDRRIITKVLLGDNRTFVGSAINTFRTKKMFAPLINGENVGLPGLYGGTCQMDTLDERLVKGKIVICLTRGDGGGPLVAGARGAIMVADINEIDVSFTVSLPASVISIEDGNVVNKYWNNTRKPMAKILRSEEVYDSKAPRVSSFSSRGPSRVAVDILKPDISAPGVDILAAWSPVASITSYLDDKRIVNYNIISGTSMACPHASGAAAYVKSFHPTWSPAAIRSALMTTASPMNANPEAEVAYGAGHINPVKAVYPGLVYDADKGDYIQMLCNFGYDTTKIRLISGDNSSSCPNAHNGTVRDLNYPSIAVRVDTVKPFTINFSRTVTNVGTMNSTYKAIVSGHSQLNITVTPSVLSFKSMKEKQKFLVTVSGGGVPAEKIISTSIAWSDGKHIVRSPIVVHTYEMPR